ncbi:MAG: hypothetical protein GF331_24115 [Chitinivibrionales bacterium]|nr:hypothetical protein [Chitinivibrionales bacterium]
MRCPDRKHPSLSAVLTCVLMLAAGCAHRTVLEPVSPLAEPDSLLHEGQFVRARKRYITLRDSLAGTPPGARAQYGLAYLNVFFRHPVPDWDQALAEFERFVEHYPEHELTDEARTWIRLLAARHALEEENHRKTAQLESAVGRSQSVRDLAASGGYDVLLDSVRRCYAEKDSLLSRIKLLEEVIETIENNP